MYKNGCIFNHNPFYSIRLFVLHSYNEWLGIFSKANSNRCIIPVHLSYWYKRVDTRYALTPCPHVAMKLITWSEIVSFNWRCVETGQNTRNTRLSVGTVMRTHCFAVSYTCRNPFIVGGNNERTLSSPSKAALTTACLTLSLTSMDALRWYCYKIRICTR